MILATILGKIGICFCPVKHIMFDNKLWPAITGIVENFDNLVYNAFQRNVCEECLQQYSVNCMSILTKS